jgi:ribosomal protein L40E
VHPEVEVFDHAKGFGQDLSPELKDAVLAIRERADEPFTCPRCGSLNPASRKSCDKCHVVSESPRVLASEIATAFSDV